ncbi:MAG TPA: response regulator, partial [Myxococcota bacterium]
MSGILFIDAEQPFADQTTAALRNRGFDVTLMDDGKEGLDVAAANRPDLIVLCVELPKMSGYSICNKLKKDNDLKGIPLIITSKEATPETFAQHKKLKTRAEDYLIKPFSEADLVEKIGGLIALPAGGSGGGASSLGADLGLDDNLDGLEGLDPPAPTSAPTPSLDDDSLNADSLGLDDDNLGSLDDSLNTASLDDSLNLGALDEKFDAKL